MAWTFDPYHKWLGIPPEEQPPGHYRLLGIKDFESDPDVIQAAADQRMAHLRTYQTGQYAEWSQRLLNEVSAARICLLQPAKKAAYDAQLRSAKAASGPPTMPTAVLPLEADVPLKVVIDVGESAPRVAPSARRGKRLPASSVIGGSLAMIGVVVMGLLYWSLGGANQPAELATQTEGPVDAANDMTPAPPDSRFTADSRSTAKKPDRRTPPEKEAVPVKTEPGLAVTEPPKPTPRNSERPVRANLVVKPAPQPEPEIPQDESTDASEPKNTEVRNSEQDANGSASDAETESNYAEEETAEESRSLPRAAVPTEQQQRQAMKLARDLFKDDLAKAKTAEEKSALARKIIAQAEETASADVGTFVLLSLARDVATQAVDCETGFYAIEQLAARFEIDSVAMKVDVLSACAKKSRSITQHDLLSQHAADALEQAVSAGQYVQAVELAKLTISAAGQARNKDLVVWAKAVQQDLQKKAKLAAEFESARKTLDVVPDDTVANGIVGAYYGYLMNNWSQALPYLAKGDDEPLRQLAADDLAGATKASDRLKLADAWWDASQESEGLKRLALLRRAGFWYSKTQRDSVSGLDKLRVEKRLDELAKAEQAAAHAGPGPRLSVPIGRWFSLMPSPTELTGWQTSECRFSYSNRIIDLRGREMYCPIIAKDVSLRAKVSRQFPSTVRLILRNSDRGCYIAQLSPSRWSLSKRTRREFGGQRERLWMQDWGEEDMLQSVAVTRNISGLGFVMMFSAIGNTLTVSMNGQPILQAVDGSFTEGGVGIGTDIANGLRVADVEILIPNKGSFVADHRSGPTPVKLTP